MKSTYGVSLIEVLLVLAIAAAIVSGCLMYYSKTRVSFQSRANGQFD